MLLKNKDAGPGFEDPTQKGCRLSTTSTSAALACPKILEHFDAHLNIFVNKSRFSARLR